MNSGEVPVSRTALVEAAEWFARLNSHDSTVEDQLQYAEWLAKSDMHIEAFAQVERTWSQSGAVPRPNIDTAHASRSGFDHLAWGNWRRWGAPTVGAAIAATALAVFFALPPSSRIYSTPLGGRNDVTLADGTEVILNSNTQVRTSLRSNARDVEILSGEALFDVSHSANRPFRVKTKTGYVEVLGTRFDVKVTAEGATVEVLRGRVRVATAGTHPVRSVLNAGHAITLSGSGLSKPRRAEPERIGAWLEGNILLDDAPLRQALDEVSRYYGIRVVAAPELSNQTITGTFAIGKPWESLALIAQALDAKIVAGKADVVMLTPKGVAGDGK